MGAEPFERAPPASDSAPSGPAGIELRSLPRVHGILALHWHRARDGAADIAAWLAGGPALGEVHVPDPSMNFSPGGLAFDDLPACAEGDILLFEARIPLGSRAWRMAGRALRVSRIPVDERDDADVGTHRIAVTLSHLEPGAEDALGSHTLRTRQAAGRVTGAR